jgi:long-subunit fatty acid transport protein
MKHVVTVIIGLVILFASYPVEAQDRWSLEIRSGAAFATQDLGDADLGVGFGFEGTVAYRFMPHLAAYAGWDWCHFSADQSFAGADVDVEETGYAFGLQFVHPLGASSLAYFIRAGGILNHIEIENDGRDIVADSKQGLGWEVGAGVVLSLGDCWRLAPGVRYRSLSRDIEIGVASTPVDLTYLAVEVGLSRSF